MIIKTKNMKKILIFNCLFFICGATFSQRQIQRKDIPAQVPNQTSKTIGATVILSFNKYDNKGMYGTLINEENGIITFKFFDSDVIAKIDNKGNILEGESYINEKKQGKPIISIQIYETKKKIVNPDIDIIGNLGNFMLLETISGFTAFGISDYNKTEQKFVLQVKPSFKTMVIKKVNNQWNITGSDYSSIKAGTEVAAIYLYSLNTRRFYTSKDG